MEYFANSIDMVVAADYGDALAPAEAARRIRAMDKNNLIKQIEVVNVPNFNTLATGFVIAQLGIHNAHKNLVIFSNTAPRGKIQTSNAQSQVIPWEGNQDQVFVYGRLKSDVPVFFVNTGFAGSGIKNELDEFKLIDIPNQGTQFRSRDIYAKACMDILNGEARPGQAIDPQTIPDLPANRINFIDGFGNIKTTVRKSKWAAELQGSEKIKIVVGGITKTAGNRVDKNGERLNGELYIQPGSSGGSDAFIEIVMIMGSAREAFGISSNYSEALVLSLERC